MIRSRLCFNKLPVLGHTSLDSVSVSWFHKLNRRKLFLFTVTDISDVPKVSELLCSSLVCGLSVDSRQSRRVFRMNQHLFLLCPLCSPSQAFPPVPFLSPPWQYQRSRPYRGRPKPSIPSHLARKSESRDPLPSHPPLLSTAPHLPSSVPPYQITDRIKKRIRTLTLNWIFIILSLYFFTLKKLVIVFCNLPIILSYNKNIYRTNPVGFSSTRKTY